MADSKQRVIFLPTIKRLPMYYRLLEQLKARQQETVSSAYIAEKLELEPIAVRKDMSSIGLVGKPRVGFSVEALLEGIDRIINYSQPNDAVLVGVGNLGQALLGYQGFMNLGLNILGGFDCDPAKVGRSVHGKEIYDISALTRLVKRLNIQTGILCVGEKAAQEMTDLMVQAGIKGIWNFTPVKLKVPEGVVVQREDLAEGLAVLTVKLNKLKNRPQ